MNENEKQLVDALKVWIRATPFRREWQITTPQQRAVMSAASRRLNAALKSAGLSKEEALLKYGPTLF